MRFPLSLTTSMVGYMARKKLARDKRFPLVLMLEPLHACNLTCTGCGRIREYSQTIKDKLSVAECLQAVDEAGTPSVSICGGEPLIYPEIGALVRGILKRRRHIYLCTNGMFIRKRLHEFRPTSRFFFNVIWMVSKRRTISPWSGRASSRPPWMASSPPSEQASSSAPTRPSIRKPISTRSIGYSRT